MLPETGPDDSRDRLGAHPPNDSASEATMPVPELLHELGRRTGIGELAMDEHGMCRLVFDDDLVVDVELVEERGRFYLRTVLGPAPEPDVDTYAAMLEAHWFGQGVGDASLALNPARDELSLMQGFPSAGVPYDLFVAGLEGFVEAAVAWREQFAGGATPASPAGGPELQDLTGQSGIRV